MYDTLNNDQVTHLCQFTELKTLAIMSSAFEKTLKTKTDDNAAAEPRLGLLANLIILDNIVSEDQHRLAGEAGLTIHTFESILKKGREVNHAKSHVTDLPNEEDVVSLVFTSGTTGDPKGVKISHKSLVQNSFSTMTRWEKDGFCCGREDSYLSFLPAAHIFEQGLWTGSAINGNKIGFF